MRQISLTLQQSVQSPHWRSPGEVMHVSLARPISRNLGEMAAKVRRSGPKSVLEASKQAKSAGLSIPGLFTLSPMPCIKAMVIWLRLA